MIRKGAKFLSVIYESDHSHMCEYCSERFSCPLDKHECKIGWRTSHNDHYLALTA